MTDIDTGQHKPSATVPDESGSAPDGFAEAFNGDETGDMEPFVRLVPPEGIDEEGSDRYTGLDNGETGADAGSA